MKVLPRYPIFIPTRGRVETQLTARMFKRDGVPFRLVVEAAEAEAHIKNWGIARVLVLPESNRGLVYSRNWIKDFSTAAGDERHWQFDDDIRYMMRLHVGRRIKCVSNIALAVAEDFVERYENVALTSFNSKFFVPVAGGFAQGQWPPFYLNHRCYTDFLMLNSLPLRWRGRYNEDTDMTLQVLAAGWCTILFNAFLINTPTTLTAPGGQMTSAAGSYQGDGRLRMSRELERNWPLVVTTGRRFQRPQHIVRDSWQKFDTPLRLKPDAKPVKDYSLWLKQVGKTKSVELAKVAAEHQ